jgi:hypothetical protein
MPETSNSSPKLGKGSSSEKMRVTARVQAVDNSAERNKVEINEDGELEPEDPTVGHDACLGMIVKGMGHVTSL